MGFEVLMAVMPCGFVGGYQQFGGLKCPEDGGSMFL
jgi:hypothetical protein